MASRVDLTPVVLAQERVDVSGTEATFAFAAGSAANGNQVPCTGHELLLVINTDSVAHTVTITGVKDPFGRSGSITTYSVPAFTTANKLAVFGPFPSEGFAQPDGKLYIDVSDVKVLLLVLKTP